jgi:DNA replication protein DnaD
MGEQVKDDLVNGITEEVLGGGEILHEKAKPDSKSKLKDKWTPLVIEKGWTAIPRTLTEYQNRLELSPIQLNVLLFLMSEWWDPEAEIFPKVREIAQRVGKTERYIRNVLKSLKEKKLPTVLGNDVVGLISIEERTRSNGQRSTNIYKLDNLVLALVTLQKIENAAIAERKLADKAKKEERIKEREKFIESFLGK